MARKMHRPGLRLALTVGSALVGFVFPPAFLVTLFCLYTVYDDFFGIQIESVPPDHTEPRFHGTAADPNWRLYYEMQCESVAEEAFLKAMIDTHQLKPGEDALVGNGIHLDMQVVVGKYRLDFLANKTYVIEIDGAEWHSSPEAVERDRIRDEYMVYQGYKVLRIPAKVVLDTPREGVMRVDAYLGRVKIEPAPVQPKPVATLATTLGITPSAATSRLTFAEIVARTKTPEFQKAWADMMAEEKAKEVTVQKVELEMNFDVKVDAFKQIGVKADQDHKSEPQPGSA